MCGVAYSNSLQSWHCLPIAYDADTSVLLMAATGARRASAFESRALAWTAFVRRCLHAPPAGVAGSETLSTLHAASGGAGWDAEAQAAAVAALAAQPPYVACLDDLDVQACNLMNTSSRPMLSPAWITWTCRHVSS